LATGAAFWNITSGPKVPSSGFGPKLPAFKGPATNSGSGSNGSISNSMPAGARRGTGISVQAGFGPAPASAPRL
jgi:hypothetical protein